jgi:hypothetical protein
MSQCRCRLPAPRRASRAPTWMRCWASGREGRARSQMSCSETKGWLWRSGRSRRRRCRAPWTAPAAPPTRCPLLRTVEGAGGVHVDGEDLDAVTPGVLHQDAPGPHAGIVLEESRVEGAQTSSATAGLQPRSPAHARNHASTLSRRSGSASARRATSAAAPSQPVITDRIAMICSCHLPPRTCRPGSASGRGAGSAEPRARASRR